MTNIRQSKKNRSSKPAQRPKRTGQLKNGRKKINMLGNAIIAENWDRSQTLTQNYRRLGLVHKLNAPAGGSEKRATSDGVVSGEPNDSLHIKGSAEFDTKKLGLGETRVERDPETGNIIRVIRDDDEFEVAGRKFNRANPLNDPLNDDMLDDDHSSSRPDATFIVQQLERQADQEGTKVSAKKPRHQSQREDEWIQRLVDKHGDDYSAMVRDRKLNPMQQSAGDLKRRIRKWSQNQS